MSVVVAVLSAMCRTITGNLLLDALTANLYIIHMKRTNLVLDESILEEAKRCSQKRTYSETVNEALREYCRIKKAAKLFDLGNSGIWDGDLAGMREDGKG